MKRFVLFIPILIILLSFNSTIAFSQNTSEDVKKPSIISAKWEPNQIVSGSKSVLTVKVANNPGSVTVKLNMFPGFSKEEPLAFIGNDTWQYKGNNMKTKSGKHTTKVSAKNKTGVDTYKTKLEIVEAFFSANQIGNHYDITVEFSDLSTGNPVSWLWDFGDGKSSTQQNPTTFYGNVGFYDVTLTVTYPNGDVSSVTINLEIE